MRRPVPRGNTGPVKFTVPGYAPQYLGKIPWICGKMLQCSFGNSIIW
jgi:hypothetical protein